MTDTTKYLGKISCCKCTKIFSTKSFHTHFQRIHLKTQTNYDNQYLIGSKVAKEKAAIGKNNVELEFNKNPKLCKCCSKPLPFEKWYANRKITFCNRTCSTTFNNSVRVIIDRKSPEFNHAPYTKIAFCCQCNKVFQRFNSYTNKTCSPECKSELLCSIQQTRIQNGWNPNLNRGRNAPSFLESSFANWLNLHQIPFQTEFPFKRINHLGEYQRTYFVDFYFEHLNLIIELDGSQHKNTIEYDTERDEYISNQYGLKIIRLTHSEYVKNLRLDEIIKELKIGAGGEKSNSRFRVGNPK